MVHLKQVDKRHLHLNFQLINQKIYSQYLTPAQTARFMSGFFDFKQASSINVLDPGAGMGALTAGILEQIEGLHVQAEFTLVEIDSILSREISKSVSNLENYKHKIILENFVEWGVKQVKESTALECSSNKYTHIILNPPYQKLLSASKHQELLSSVGIQVSNLYAAFVALSLSLLKDDGELVAIIPRSFCNGLYSKAFREYILKESAILKIHLFESRHSIFKSDSVSQENIIIHLKKNSKQGNVLISNSTDDSLHDYQEKEVNFNEVVRKNDPELFIRIPSLKNVGETAYYERFKYSLEELGLSISTGPVVNYRVKDYLSEQYEYNQTVPLFHPQHIEDGKIKRKKNLRKKSYIKLNKFTEALLYPDGYYLVMRRRTTKEEKHRFVTAVHHEAPKSKKKMVGFENGLNIIHSGKKGLDKEVAYGLHAYFQSKQVETYFRTFNGHTQVNVTDIRNMKFPSLNTLKRLGSEYYQAVEINKSTFDIEQWFNQVILSKEETI